MAAYPKTNWVDGVTPTSAANMNKIEAELEALRNIVDAPVTLAKAPAGGRYAAPLNGSLNTSATTARPSPRTDIFFDWYSTVQPTNMLSGDNWDAPAS